MSGNLQCLQSWTLSRHQVQVPGTSFHAWGIKGNLIVFGGCIKLCNRPLSLPICFVHVEDFLEALIAQLSNLYMHSVHSPIKTDPLDKLTFWSVNHVLWVRVSSRSGLASLVSLVSLVSSWYLLWWCPTAHTPSSSVRSSAATKLLVALALPSAWLALPSACPGFPIRTCPA